MLISVECMKALLLPNRKLSVGLLKILTLNKSTKIIINYAISISLFTWLAFSIYKQIRHQQDLQVAIRQIGAVLYGSRVTGLLLVVILMLLNWGIEAKKWQLLINPLEKISLVKSFFAIMTGVSFAINTPNRIGEYGGRIVYLRNRNKLRGVSLTAVGSFSQFIVTILFGIAGLIFFISHYSFKVLNTEYIPGFWEKSLLIVLVFIGIATLILYFRLDLFVDFFHRWAKWKKLQNMVEVIGVISNRDLLVLMILSVVRYVVFTAQYLILLGLLGVAIQWGQGFLMISLTYLIMALVPTITIIELGIRGKVNLYFLGFLSANKIGIIAGTFGIWLINLILPAILGSILLLGVKIFSDK
jgi:uncharacterized membrane protein YbhN (UPF0104 family)